MSEENMSDNRITKSKPCIPANSLPDNRRASDTNLSSSKWVHSGRNGAASVQATSARPRESAGSSRQRANERPWQNQARKMTVADEEIREWRAKRDHQGSQRGGGNYHWQQPKWMTCYNKEQYVQATCQFVVNHADGPFDGYLRDPDLFMDWEKVQELRLVEDAVPNCPICLMPPTAAKMTRCGHVYCWPCILHYLSLSDKAWRKCPICYESVYKYSLKSVTTVPQKVYEVNDAVKFTLMKRLKNSALALPCESWHHQTEPARVEDPGTAWSKIIQCSPEYIRDSIIQRERDELTNALAACEEEPEQCFLHEALELMHRRKEGLVFDKTGVSEKPVAATESPSPTNDALKADKVVSFDDAFNNESHEVDGASSQKPATRETPAAARPEAQKSSGTLDSSGGAVPRANVDSMFYYFYQAEDGQRMFLHPVSTRMLLAEYGGWSSVPLRVTGRVVEMEGLSMDADVRARFKPLGHLPLTSQFQLAEVKFDRGIVSRSTLDSFQDVLTKRKNLRYRKKQQEKRQDLRAEQWHKAMMMQSRGYIIPGGMSNLDNVNIDIPSDTVIPSAQAEIEAGTSESPPQQQDFSFAQMLRYGVARRSDHLPSAAAASQLNVPSEQRQIAEDDEETLPAPRYQDSFGSALAAAFENLATEKKEEKKSSGKKKKKGKVIFSL